MTETSTPEGPTAREIEEFPRIYAQTQRFSQGMPRGYKGALGGRSVVFLRSKSQKSTALCLWRLDVDSGKETLLADSTNLDLQDAELSAQEAARRERTRESGSGIVSYQLDSSGVKACFTASGSLFVVEIETGEIRKIVDDPAIFDPRLSPNGNWIAYVKNSNLHVIDCVTPNSSTLQLTASDKEEVGYGQADFVAAEEMGRLEGFWWSPSSDQLLATKVDESKVNSWWISDPSDPNKTPNQIRYPAAGTTNATTELVLIDFEGNQTPIDWSSQGQFEYLADVIWNSHGITLIRQTRDQRHVSIVSVDLATQEVSEVQSIKDDAWVDLHPTSPTVTDYGVFTIETNKTTDTQTLFLDGSQIFDTSLTAKPISVPENPSSSEGANPIIATAEPIELGSIHVKSILGVQGQQILLSGWTQPNEIHVFLYDMATDTATIISQAHSTNHAIILTNSQTDQAEETTKAKPLSMLLTSSSATAQQSEARLVQVELSEAQTTIAHLHTIKDFSNSHGIVARPAFQTLGKRDLNSALFLPSDHDGVTPLPVLLDPYGGPHAQRVLQSHKAHLLSQWFADSGMAVLVTDGRGTPGKGPAWEREVSGGFSEAVLQDQIDGLEDAANRYPFMDTNRVGIRGWSFGGYLAALAVMDAPDVFGCAISGAPVTDWRLYDTHYTERYLGDPNEHPDVYNQDDLIRRASNLTRPLLLIHGLADDNVVAANTLQLSNALLAAGAPHEVLPLCGVTHMTPQTLVAENLLRLQLDFLQRTLDIDRSEPTPPLLNRVDTDER